MSKITFLIGSRSNTAKNFGEKVKKYIAAFNQSIAIDQVDIDNLSIQEVEEVFKNCQKTLYVMFMASYPNKDFCENFIAYLTESSNDWRIGSGKVLKFSTFVRISVFECVKRPLGAIGWRDTNFAWRFDFWCGFILRARKQFLLSPEVIRVEEVIVAITIGVDRSLNAAV